MGGKGEGRRSLSEKEVVVSWLSLEVFVGMYYASMTYLSDLCPCNISAEQQYSELTNNSTCERLDKMLQNKNGTFVLLVLMTGGLNLSRAL